MNKQKLNKLSLYCLIIAVVVFIINYFFYHFVTDEGISLTWNPEPGKPFVSDLIGMLAVLFLFASIFIFLISKIWFDKKD